MVPEFPELSIRAGDAAPLLSSALLLSGLVLLAEACRRILGTGPEFSRKFVHIGTGFLIALAPQWIDRPQPILLICLVFIPLNLFAIHRGWLPGIHGTRRRSFGTVYYPLSLFVLTFLYWERAPHLVVVPMLVLALGDGLAGIVGEMLPHPHVYRVSTDKKSVEGSTTMFLVTGTVLLLSMQFMHPLVPFIPSGALAWPVVAGIIATAAFVAVSEAVGSGGLDNLLVPLATAFSVSFCFSTPGSGQGVQYATGAALGAAMALLSHRFRALTTSGAVGMFLLATIIFAGGWAWTLPILVFFLSSSALSQAGRSGRISLASILEKDSSRDLGQVFANGGVAALIAAAGVSDPGGPWFPLYLGTLAAVTADTWSTEIGIRAHAQPVNILTGRRLHAGMSGGITLQGSIGGALGAALIATVGLAVLPAGERSPGLFLFVVVSGVIGSLVDSVLGASIQGRYRCVRCGAETERREHCGHATQRERGFRWMTNDAVNTACAVAGALAMWVLAQAL